MVSAMKMPFGVMPQSAVTEIRPVPANAAFWAFLRMVRENGCAAGSVWVGCLHEVGTCT